MSINGPVQNGDLFIFYGLLKKGAVGMPETIDLESDGAFLGRCRFRGDLYSFGTFPGIVDGDTLCHGMLYRLDRRETADALDAFEEVMANDPDGSLYQRVHTKVMDDHGEETGQSAWIYMYNQSIDDAPLIADGNWPLGGNSQALIAETTG